MENNQVTISLKDYLKSYDYTKELENKLSQLSSLILNYTELNDKKQDLRIDGYEMKYGRLLDIIKEIMPEEYNERLSSLLKDEE